ncbi:MAG: hypothetical protein JSS64_02460 [Bacteroidetes bacterium]|nr:hypothetical protein [Bacteroidota bacterium]
MRRFIFIFLWCAMAMSGFAQHFRTDGYYFYDNNVDTLFMMPIDRQQDSLIHELLRAELNVEHIYSPCMPMFKVPLEGSTFFHYLCFFNEGTAYAGACRDSFLVSQQINHMLIRRLNLDTSLVAKTQTIRSISIKDSTFTFRVSTEEDGYFQETFSGRFLPNGDLRLKAFRSIDPVNGVGQVNAVYNQTRTYHFYPFDEMPPCVRRQYFVEKKKGFQ